MTEPVVPAGTAADRAWLIYFEDPDRAPEVFYGQGAEEAARARSAEVGLAWNHTLFAAVSGVGSQPAERLARQFHEAYERLAPSFGYETRKESAVPWEQVPEQNRKLMVAVAAEVLAGSQPATELSESLTGTGSVDEPGECADAKPLGWHVISGEHLLECLRRVSSGEDPDLLFAELWANAEHEEQ